MKRITEREIRRLLSSRDAPDAPPGLAERIKAEIPDVLQVGPPTARPPHLHGLALRPFWLVAASLLVVIGAGFVAVRLITPAPDLAREIALGGVVRIADIVVTVPERSTVEGTAAGAGGVSRFAARAEARSSAPFSKAAPAGTTAARREPAASRPPAGSLAVTVTDGNRPLEGVTVTARRAGDRGTAAASAVSGQDGRAELRALPAGRYDVRTELPGFRAETSTVRVAGGVEDHLGLALTQEKVAEEVTVGGTYLPVAAAEAAQTNAAVSGAPAAPAAKGSLVVTVRDETGRPIAGVTVMLALSDRPDVACGFRVTGNAGVATFCCVVPATYRLCAQLPGYAPVSADGLAVASGRQGTTTLTMRALPAAAGDARWTCPTPRPSGTP